MKEKIGIISLGCAKNLVNTEQMMYLLREAGYEISGEIEGAAAVLVNTCGFIESAKMEAIETILELGNMKSEGRIGKVIVAGCLAERYKNEVLDEMPEIDAIVGTGSFDDIVEAVKGALESDVRIDAVAGSGSYDDKIEAVKGALESDARVDAAAGTGNYDDNVEAAEGALGTDARIDAAAGTGSFDNIVEAAEGAFENDSRSVFFGDINAPVSETKRIISTSTAWAYLKIAEGCDNNCAYCSIPMIRGRFRSRKMENILSEAAELAQLGYMELIIVAQDITRYGLDLYGKPMLATLLKELCTIKSLKWIRLHYLYPDEIDKELVDVIAESDIILKYLDIPIQHINSGILKKMGRRGTGDDIRELFRTLRERIPNLVLRTSIITGLPGEGDAEFEELGRFLTETKIQRAGVFAYSPEEGTPASLMERPDTELAAHRAQVLMDIQSRVMDEYNNSRIGSVETVLIEGRNDSGYYGRSYAESPEIDGYINVEGEGIDIDIDIDIDEFAKVLITGEKDGELFGVRVLQ